MTEYGDLSFEFVAEERDVAYRQAGTQVVIELVVLLALVVGGVWWRAWASGRLRRAHALAVWMLIGVCWYFWR